jgi:CMP-N-acetylneuraminic acid synthetase
MELIGFVPCRAGSERVKNKNTRPFAGFQGGLLELKLRQLAQVESFSEILVSSNDEVVLEFTRAFAREVDERFVPLERPDHLGRGSTSMTEFIHYIARLREAGVVFWTHVTSPLLTASHYDEGVKSYGQAIDQGCDSLVSVTLLHKFLWNAQGPLNYDNTVEKWPRSQDLDPVFEINHGIYMLPFSLMREVDDRIGRKPFFYATDEEASLDIDREDQFLMIEQIAGVKQQQGLLLKL